MKIAVYTRMTEPYTYTSYLGNSVHFAISMDDIHYQELNQNYGILFARATIGEDNTIQAKGVINPYIFKTRDGKLGITITRVNVDGSEDKDNSGKVLLWTSEDLIHFSEEKWINLQNGEELSVYKEDGISLIPDLSDIKGAIPGNAIEVEKEIIDNLLLQWRYVENISVQVPDAITVSSQEDVEAAVAKTTYSDGSTSCKKVLWNTEDIDFSKPGKYEIEGTVLQNNYKFPMAVGYADPDLIKWKGDYYFIATNDNTDSKGLYVRKAGTVDELFASGAKEHLILEVDPRRQLIQTFWAPEFHIIGGRLYILFAVSGEVWGPQSHMMRLKKGGNILNPDDWEDPIRVIKEDGTYLAEDSCITLDMTYFSVEDTAYLVWSHRENIGTPLDSGSMIYIATINPKKPWVLTSEPVLLSRPIFGWENNNQTINNEGPYPLITDKNVYITYSGGAAGGYTYVLGLLTATIGEDLLDVKNWSKSSAPVLSYYSVEGEYGPGHNTFFEDDDGNIMIAYHAQERMESSPRCTGIRRVHFDKRGIPRFDMSTNRDLKEDCKKVHMKIFVL